MSARRLLQLILMLVIGADGVALLLDDELPIGLAVAAFAPMIAWWRFKLPPP